MASSIGIDLRSSIKGARTKIGSFAGERRGNVLIIMAFSMLPLTAATGMAIDYSRAARLQTKVNSAADAAALAAVTTPMMSQPIKDAAQAASRMFISQASGLQGLTWKTPLRATPTASQTLTTYTLDYGAYKVVVTDINLTGLSRTATVSYDALSHNTFSNVLKLEESGIGGSATATAKTAPNVDFHILLDTSGSMALPSTSSGLTLLTSKTNGCAFACHSTNDATAIAKDGSRTDYYGVARSYGIVLRIDEAKSAVQAMMTQAASTGAANKAKYRASLSTFAAADSRSNNYFTTRQGITSVLTDVSNSSKGVASSLYYSNGCPTKDYCNNDQDTASSDAFSKMNSMMQAPGSGTNLLLDKPQAVMFIITDGMRDESRPGGKPEAEIDRAWCTTIKARGIRIGVLYTEYLPESLSDSWSKDNVKPNLYKVEPALKDCASDGLYSKVTTDDDITAALNKLFSQAVSTARITE
ncbi:pilus assembly protein TadG-related protein [Sphingomonas sp. Tas61C01]|uniref:pilus assembly protein TadG-related protein n=1 Tax=Sphingomonas sp. Tas61C01 TaxID=3458297 RepID=UPI00403E8FED